MGPQMRASLVALLVVVTVCLSSNVRSVEATLQYNFYGYRCPNVESIVFQSMKKSYAKDKTVAAGIVRLIFHDCFVNGCDASVLLAGNTTERAAPNNAGLHGFEAIDAAKAAVEKACPGVVSCADILAFASRDSVILTRGKGWRVPSGRRDGTVSLAAQALANLPPSTFNSKQLIANFAAKGLSPQQMVDLSGSHTLGVTHCVQMRDRIFTTIDPTMPKDLLATLQKKCPSIATPTPLTIDQYTPDTFDTIYYQNLVKGRGLMTSDQTLYADPATRPFVQANLNQRTFNQRFAAAMVAMTNISPKTGRQGEIRRRCQFVNE